MNIYIFTTPLQSMNIYFTHCDDTLELKNISNNKNAIEEELKMKYNLTNFELFECNGRWVVSLEHRITFEKEMVVDEENIKKCIELLRNKNIFTEEEKRMVVEKYSEIYEQLFN